LACGRPVPKKGTGQHAIVKGDDGKRVGASVKRFRGMGRGSPKEKEFR